MSIYKHPPGYNKANFRQGAFWAFWGILTSIYVCQPFLRYTHRDEKSILAEYLEEDIKKSKPQPKATTQNDIKT